MRRAVADGNSSTVHGAGSLRPASTAKTPVLRYLHASIMAGKVTPVRKHPCNDPSGDGTGAAQQQDQRAAVSNPTCLRGRR